MRAELGLRQRATPTTPRTTSTWLPRRRFSFGYGACPKLEDRAKVTDLLEPGRIGVKLSEEFQLHPEQSTDALVLHHPEATYFNAK